MEDLDGMTRIVWSIVGSAVSALVSDAIIRALDDADRSAVQIARDWWRAIDVDDDDMAGALGPEDQKPGAGADTGAGEYPDNFEGPLPGPE